MTAAFPAFPAGLAVVLALAAGAVAGRWLRVLLRWLRRGACAPPGACEAGVAVAVAAPMAAGGLGFAEPAWLPVWVALGVLGVAVTVTDLAHRRIPDALTGPGLVLLVLLVVPLGVGALAAGLAGALLLGGAHAAVHLMSPRSLGGGDVKLAGVLGVPLAAGSWLTGTPTALVLAPVLTAVVAVVVVACTRSRTVALGPVAAGVAWCLVGVLAVSAGPP